MQERDLNEEALLILPSEVDKPCPINWLPLEILEQVLQEAVRDGSDLKTKRNVQLVCRVFRVVFLFDKIKVSMPIMENPYDPRSVEESFFFHTIDWLNRLLTDTVPFMLYVPYPFFYDLKDFCASLFDWWKEETRMPASYFILQGRRIVNAFYVLDGARACRLSRIGAPLDLDHPSLERVVKKDGARVIFFDPMKLRNASDVEKYVPEWIKRTPWVKSMIPAIKK